MSSNRLVDATSSYLRQHADQPVHWQPWDAAALTEAESRDCPILLSVGHEHSTECTRMARDVWSSPAIAELLNRGFVCIKVDRDERPDLERAYQIALTLLNRAGPGTPMTAFLDPVTRLPFFGGGFFPGETARGVPGFADVIERVQDAFNDHRTDMNAQCARLAAALRDLAAASTESAQLTDDAMLTAARTVLDREFDEAEGGFGTGAKLPMSQTLERLLLDWARRKETGTPDRIGLDRVMHTLTRMARGGIHDHLGGGFFRYAFDRKWLLPRFEKRVAENGQLLGLFADAHAVSRDALFESVIEGIAGWMIGAQTLPSGGFAISECCEDEDAGIAAYGWRRNEVRQLLDEDAYLVVETLYGLDKPASHGTRWVLARRDAWRAVVERLSLEPDTAAALLESARARLLAQRQTRPQPFRPTRLSAAANGHAIYGLARASMRRNRPAWLNAARGAADAVRTVLWRDGRLCSSAEAGQAVPLALLEDHAAVLWGLLALLEADWREEDARFALDVAEALVAGFADPADGGFFPTHHDAPPLICRIKPTLEEALPAAAGLAVRALQVAASLFGRSDFQEVARRALNAARPSLAQFPAGHATLLAALEADLVAHSVIVLRGPADGLAAWREAVSTGYHPWRRVYAIPYGSNRTLPRHLPKLVSAHLQQITSAYWCTPTAAEPPITSLEAFSERLGRR